MIALTVAREHVSRIEAGAQPGTDVLRRVAEVTGTSLDFLVYGAGGALGETAAGAGSPDLEISLGRLLVGTTLRLPQMSVAQHRRTERAWRELPEERRNDVRGLVQRTGLVAVAIEGLFSTKVAKPVIDQLGEAPSRPPSPITSSRPPPGQGRRSLQGHPRRPTDGVNQFRPSPRARITFITGAISFSSTFRQR